MKSISLAIFMVFAVQACGEIHPLQRGKPGGEPSSTTSHSQVSVSLPSQGDTPTSGEGERLFKSTVFQNMQKRCVSCHNGMDQFNMTGDQDKDYSTSLTKITPRDPGKSLMWLKSSGSISHGGGARWKPGSQELKDLEAWINAETAR